MSTSSSNTYIPGVCNIGPDELRVRRNSTYFSALLSIVYVAVVLVLDLADWWRLLLFFPLAGFVISFQQTYFKFCVYFGMKGLFNIDKLGQMDTVQQAEMRKQDQAKAIKMLIVAIITSLAVAVLFYLM